MNELEAQRNALLKQHSEIKNHPEIVVDAGKFIIQLSKRCRRCYALVLFSCSKKDITMNDQWFNIHLCNTCKIFYNNINKTR